MIRHGKRIEMELDKIEARYACEAAMGNLPEARALEHQHEALLKEYRKTRMGKIDAVLSGISTNPMHQLMSPTGDTENFERFREILHRCEKKYHIYRIIWNLPPARRRDIFSLFCDR
ncbi:MAG: hypothetical protein ACREGH_01615 [Minisyncoccia bacterium]